MTKTVFVVERGCWEDYEIVGCYERREDAERIAGIINCANIYDPAEVDEWELNPGIGHLDNGESIYQVEMTGIGLVTKIEKMAFDPATKTFLRIYMKMVNIFDGEGRVEAKTISGRVWAKDEREAARIADEYRLDAIKRGDIPGVTEEASR